MKIKCLLSSLLLANISLAATYVLSDDLNPDGSGVNDDNYAAVETTSLHNQNGQGQTSDPSFYNAIVVGASYGSTGNGIWRAVTTFNLDDLPDPTVGFEYVVTDVTIRLEQSDNRPGVTVDFFEGAQPTGELVDYLATQNYAANQSGNFVSTSLGATSLNLNTDSTFTFTMNAPNASSGEYHTFGSGLGPNGVGLVGGTMIGSVDLSPQLTITFDLVPVPEPSSLILGGLGLLALVSRRKR